MVLMLAAIIVFINSYPNVPEIAESTNDYRQQMKSRLNLNRSEQDLMKIEAPEAPSIPNTITPFISPEDVNDIANPKPKPKPTPEPTPGDGAEPPIKTEDSQERSEPPLEIKLLTGFLNVAPLILIAAFGGFGIYFLFKKKKHFTLRSMFGVAIALVAVCTLLFFTIITLNFAEFLYNFDWSSDLVVLSVLPVAILLGGWLSYNIISKGTTVFKRNFGLVFAGALMGAFLAAFLPFWMVFILLIGITLFDIYSVKFGPIKKIMELEEKANKIKIEKRVFYRTIAETAKNDDNNINSNNHKDGSTIEENATKPKDGSKTIKVERNVTENKNNSKNAGPSNRSQKMMKRSNLTKDKKKNDDDFDLMLMFDNPDWSLGLGDFVIYSMFTSAVLTYCMLYLPYYIFYSPILGFILPWVIFFFCTLGLLIGFFVTLKLLDKYSYLPGLPISIGCGLLVFIICIITLQIINYIMFNEFAIIF